MPNKIKDNMSNDVNIILFTYEIQESYITKLLGETLNCASLDGGCTCIIKYMWRVAA